MAEKIKLGSNGNFGVKEGGTLAYNDENGVFKAIELASSRASSGTYVAESGLIADAEVGVPRIDWTNGVGELLLEPQRRNLVTSSEDFTDSSWTKQDTVVNSNAIVSPSGLNDADELVFSDVSARIIDSIVTSNTVQFSVYMKCDIIDVGKTVRLRDASGAIVNDIELTNEWVRYVLEINVANTNVQIQRGQTGTPIDSVYIWGAQVEDDGAGGGASYPTSYIRTSGTTATRIADAVTGNSSLGQVINSSEGVLYFEGSALANDGLTKSIGLNNGTSSVGVVIRFRSTANEIQFLLKDGVNPDVGNTLILSDATQDSKFALKWKNQDIAFWVNGVEELTSTSTMNISGLTDLDFNTFGSFYGRIRELKVYDTALTDAQLQTLTTI